MNQALTKWLLLMRKILTKSIILFSIRICGCVLLRKSYRIIHLVG